MTPYRRRCLVNFAIFSIVGFFWFFCTWASRHLEDPVRCYQRKWLEADHGVGMMLSDHLLVGSWINIFYLCIACSLRLAILLRRRRVASLEGNDLMTIILLGIATLYVFFIIFWAVIGVLTLSHTTCRHTPIYDLSLTAIFMQTCNIVFVFTLFDQ